MRRGNTSKLWTEINVVVVVVVVVVFLQMETCNFHGFSPQELTSHSDNVRAERDVNSFYDSLLSSRYDGKVQYSKNGDILTREVRIKQGRLKGVVREFKTKKLRNVETYLGVPYAAPPIKSLRFMPPGSPPSWKDVKIFDSFGPVCPQTPPDLSHEPFKTMNAGYYNRLKGLVPFLNNQSEDCLYLNIYAPIQDWKSQQKHPVIVYVHGESFEWNSGNPYDGSVLASYGNVVVVTINFRLGILGFLRPGLSEHTISNFGLLDQIAALQWIKDNIEEFGGDSSLVTLMGHGTGAACINFLMVSPVSMASQGLFHKAILMSGTALADWALTHNPLQSTIQVAEALNCPLVDKDDELSNCLRRKRLSEIMSVKISVPEFQTPFGPIVDGSVVPNTPQQVMGIYQSLFTRYELLYGITEWESYHILDPVSLTYGMLEGERNDFLRKYMYSRYEALPYFALATTLSQYLDWRKAIPPSKSAAEEHRDLVLDLLSDARFAAPVIQMALYHSKINPKSYLYVFFHKSKMGEFAGSERSISGEEISYVFGIPLVNEEGPLSHHKFSLSEQLLSEHILTYFTNFAKTGNPNAPRRLEFVTQGPREWQQYDLYWPEYDSVNQSYLALGIPPHIAHHYRFQMTQYWNEILPDLLSNPTKLKQPKPELPTGGLKNASYQSPSYFGTRNAKQDPIPWTHGIVRVPAKEYHPGKRPYKPEEDNPSLKQMDRPLEDSEISNADSNTSSAAIPYFIAVSVCLLLINVVVIGFYCYKKRKPSERNTNESVAYEGVGRRKSSQGDSVYSVVECSDRSKSSKCEKSGRLKKYLNSERQVKVKKWILEKYSKSRKNSEVSLELAKDTKSNSLSEGSIRTTAMPKPILKNSNRIYRSSEDLKMKRSVQKISVGIDATPSTRGESVLKQTPIEITKSLDRGLKMGSRDLTPRRSRTSVSLQMLPIKGDVKFVTSEPETIKMGQEPRPSCSKTLQTFQVDVNVTSRDSKIEQERPYTDPLENIQKRNFPKVLPDYPESRNKPNPPPPPPRVSTLQRKSSGDGKREDDDSSATDSSKASVIQKKPAIVIKPKIGPKKQDLGQRGKTAHINLQTDKKSKTPPRVLDSKGPSDKKPKTFRI